MLTGTIPQMGFLKIIFMERRKIEMSRRRSRGYGYSTKAYDRIASLCLEPQPPNGYQCQYFMYLSDEDNSIRVHPSGKFCQKGKNGVCLDRFPRDVKGVCILEYQGKTYSKIYVPFDWKVFYFHDLPQLLEVEYNNDGYIDYYFFRYDEYKRDFIEVIYDSEIHRFVDKE